MDQAHKAYVPGCCKNEISTGKTQQGTFSTVDLAAEERLNPLDSKYSREHNLEWPEG